MPHTDARTHTRTALLTLSLLELLIAANKIKSFKGHNLKKSMSTQNVRRITVKQGKYAEKQNMVDTRTDGWMHGRTHAVSDDVTP